MSNENPKIEVRDLRNGDWLWTHKVVLFSELPDSAYRVYSALAAFADNRDQRSWPSMVTIAKLIVSSKSTVLRSMRVLELCGLVRVERRDGTSNLYTLLPCKEVKMVGPKKETSPHHRLIDFFDKATLKLRGVKVSWGGKDVAHLKRVLAHNVLTENQIEQLMVVYLAAPKYKKFAPTMSVFFSAGIFTGLMNDMQNSETFWKEVDMYTERLYGEQKRRVIIPMKNMTDLIAKISNKMLQV